MPCNVTPCPGLSVTLWSLLIPLTATMPRRSATWACNFVNHCYDIAANILAAHHLPFDVMLPLIDETARKVHSLSPHDAQTGPAVRYDENVIAAQSALMADDPELQQLYELLSKSIHRQA